MSFAINARVSFAAMRRAPRLSSATLSTSAFDEEMTAVYNRLSENHRHENGPWPKMTQVVVDHAKAQGGMFSFLTGAPKLTVLDLASGPAEPAATIAKALPDSTIIATDFSEDMVAAATKVVESIPNASAQQADASDLATFDDGSMDVVTCCYGYMFPADKDAALAETFRVLKPGGIMVATTWDRVDMLPLVKDIMTPVLGFEPPPPPVNPMSLSEEGLFLSMVEKAGFSDITQSTSTYPFNFGSEESFQFKVGTLLVKDKIEEFGEEGWAKAREAFQANIGKYSETNDEGEMVLPNNTFRMTVATKK